MKELLRNKRSRGKLGFESLKNPLKASSGYRINEWKWIRLGPEGTQSLRLCPAQLLSSVKWEFLRSKALHNMKLKMWISFLFPSFLRNQTESWEFEISQKKTKHYTRWSKSIKLRSESALTGSQRVPAGCLWFTTHRLESAFLCWVNEMFGGPQDWVRIESGRPWADFGPDLFSPF